MCFNSITMCAYFFIQFYKLHLHNNSMAKGIKSKSEFDDDDFALHSIVLLFHMVCSWASSNHFM